MAFAEASGGATGRNQRQAAPRRTPWEQGKSRCRRLRRFAAEQYGRRSAFAFARVRSGLSRAASCARPRPAVAIGAAAGLHPPVRSPALHPRRQGSARAASERSHACDGFLAAAKGARGIVRRRTKGRPVRCTPRFAPILERGDRSRSCAIDAGTSRRAQGDVALPRQHLCGDAARAVWRRLRLVAPRRW